MVKASRKVDWALTFGVMHLRKLIVFLLPVIPIQWAVAYSARGGVVADKNLFLLEVASYLSSAWLLTVVCFYVVLKLRSQVAGRLTIAVDALKLMPKVGLSYMVLISFLLLAFQFPPALLALVYLMWGPLFTALESSVTDEFKEEALKNDEPGPSILDYEEGEERPRPSYFHRKSIFDLGLVRSSIFASKHMPESICFIISIWAVNAIPYGIFSLISTPGGGGLFELLLLASISIFELVVLSAAVLSFILMLPEEALKELGLPAKPNFKKLIKNRKTSLFNVSKSRFKLSILAFISLGATVMVLSKLAAERQFPTTAFVEALSVESKEDDLLIKVQIEDAEKNFSWFDEKYFKIQYLSNQPKQENLEGEESTIPQKVLELDAKVVRVFNEVDERIFDKRLIYQEALLTLELVFPMPDNLPKSGKYNLIFQPLQGMTSGILSGEFSRDEIE